MKTGSGRLYVTKNLSKVQKENLVINQAYYISILIVFSLYFTQARDPPGSYLRKLQTYLDPKASKSFKVRKPLQFRGIH